MEHRRECAWRGLRFGLTLALRVNTKLGTLSLSEDILLPRVHDELGSSQQTLQRRLGRIGRILLEGLLQIGLEQSVGTIILARSSDEQERDLCDEQSNLLRSSASESAGMSL